jgi:hypothetical protein
MGCCFGKPGAEAAPEVAPDAAPEVAMGHVRRLSNHYTVHYPPHEPRKPSNIYNKTHRAMKTMPCFVCGKTNAADGIYVETHHFYCEKVFQTVFDWPKFGEFAANCHNLQTGELIGPLFDWAEVARNPDLFVDSPHNMIVLCKEHHTSGARGIHHVPFPDWLAQKFAKVEVLSAAQEK